MNVARAVAVVTGTVTAAAMIATPLVPRGGRQRRALSSVVVVAMAATTAANAGARWGTARALTALGAVGVTTTVIEGVGTATGVPFGRYEYTDALRPRVGRVPAIVPLAWFAMAVPAREVAHAAIGPRSGRTSRVVVGAAALTAWDLFLDPQMVGEGYWRWARRGWYRGIPLGNYVGWFATGLGVMAIIERALPVADPVVGGLVDRTRRAPDASLVATYGLVGLMETIGFARYFRDPVVATIGGIGMLPLAAAAIVRQTRTRGATT
ncbi:MAG: carotenoid biosynthesis protein [Ilumatobacteraceae bacterium]